MQRTEWPGTPPTMTRALEADLIVMYSHGRKGLARLVAGSVVERVVRLTNCPVLILK